MMIFVVTFDGVPMRAFSNVSRCMDYIRINFHDIELVGILQVQLDGD